MRKFLFYDLTNDLFVGVFACLKKYQFLFTIKEIN